jgi:hypothetical protein
MLLLRTWVLVGVVLLFGCGAKTSIPGGFEGLDVVEEEERASGVAGAGAEGGAGGGGKGGTPVTPGPFLEDCYTPGKDGRPTGACLKLDDPLLPALFTNCPFPAILRSGPITDINITTGVTRCCYEISGETCG